ncbi:MAG: SDR family oxidoreductase [Spirochaetales bacterium]|nr:SDR family oxidoreductase [Spirochaetales bacterium]
MSELYKLKGKRALVTGGARRLGEAICRALAAEGVDLVIHYNTSAREAEELARDLTGAGATAKTIRADLSRKDEYESLVARGVAAAGPIDLLVNNASIFPPGRIDRMSESDLFSNITVNALAPLVVSREFAKQVGEGGAIVNLLDTRIVEYDRAHAAYHVSKRLLADFTRMTALEFAPRVRVNAVAPGLVLPPEGMDAEYFAGRIKDVPLGRHGEPGDVARAVVFLLASPFVTGEVLFVDGGQRLRGDMYGF